MKRITVVEAGKVVCEHEKLWRMFLEHEEKVLRDIDAKFRREDPDNYKDVRKLTDEEWKEEAEQSTINAAFRLGCGDVTLTYFETGDAVEINTKIYLR